METTIINLKGEEEGKYTFAKKYDLRGLTYQQVGKIKFGAWETQLDENLVFSWAHGGDDFGNLTIDYFLHEVTEDGTRRLLATSGYFRPAVTEKAYNIFTTIFDEDQFVKLTCTLQKELVTRGRAGYIEDLRKGNDLDIFITPLRMPTGYFAGMPLYGELPEGWGED